MREKIEPGMKLGKLTIISEAEPSRGAPRWNCKCDCGNDVVLNDAVLRKGIINNCGCSSKFADLTGQKFGLLTVLSREPIVHPNGRPRWRCLCDCGKETVVEDTYLKLKKLTPNCGHLTAAKPKPEIVPGLVAGKLTVIEKADPGKYGGLNWITRCECGNTFIANESSLKRHAVASCGCAHKDNAPDIIGNRYGRLEVLYQTIDTPQGRPQWVCICDCGNICTKSYRALTVASKEPSCGCYNSERISETHSKHGMVNTPIWNVWYGMRQRCYYPKHISYKWYGAKGITVCDRWNALAPKERTTEKCGIMCGRKQKRRIERSPRIRQAAGQDGFMPRKRFDNGLGAVRLNARSIQRSAGLAH